jgi:hypothetical protein
MRRQTFIAIILFVLTIALKLYFDVHLYFSGGLNNHLTGPILVACSLIICSGLTYWISFPMWFLCYWAMFDTLYALFIGQGAFYVGATAKLDIVQRDHPSVQILKYLFALLIVYIFILLNKKEKI